MAAAAAAAADEIGLRHRPGLRHAVLHARKRRHRLFIEPSVKERTNRTIAAESYGSTDKVFRGDVAATIILHKMP